MLAGINSLKPVTFEYAQDEALLFNQNAFTTQQGLNISVVNALCGARDELIQNYSNIFLSGLLPVKDVLKLTDIEAEYTSFPTYLALSAYPNFNATTRYLTLCATNAGTSNFVILPALSAPNDNYFCFQNIDDLNCRIYNITFDNKSTCLTVDLPTLSCHLVPETSTIIANKSNIFRFNLDDTGFLKLFFIPSNGRLHAIRFVNDKLSAVDVSLYPAATGDIISTIYRNWQSPNLQNDFVYYSRTKLKDFYLDIAKTKKDIAQNYLLYYNYDDPKNFLDDKPTTAKVSFFKTKNILSNEYNVNDRLPLQNEIIQRNYTSILSRQNSELYDGNLQLNYTFYTKEYIFGADTATKFVLPDTLYPFNSLNIEDSNLIRSGAYGGQTPVFADKVTKSLNINDNTVKYNEANGTYLYTWLYTNSDQTTAYWVDRFYYPERTSLNKAFAGSVNQIFSFTSSLSNYLAQYNNQPQLQYYDIRSSLVFEASATYYYSRIGNNYVAKVLNSIPNLSSFNIVDLRSKTQYVDSVLPQHLNYGFFVISPNNGSTSLTLAFDINTLNDESICSNLIVGNNFDEGVNIYKGGAKNIFTPGYFINTLTGVDFYNTANVKTFTFDIRDYVDSGTRILDVINTGFDHVIKLFYVNSSYVPGFVDLSITGNVFNKYEFASLANIFAVGNNIKLYSKYYVGANQIWYLVKSDAGVPAIYKFDYISNEYVGTTSIAANTVCNSFVVKPDGSFTTLSGYRGQILDSQYGVSKVNDTVYMKDLSTNIEYPSLCGAGSSVFDLLVYGDRMYVQLNDRTIVYDKYKKVEHIYYSTLNSVSGLKIDFINENFKTLFASYTINLTGGILLEKFNLNESLPVSVHYYGEQAKQQFLGEFNKPVQGYFNNLEGIGIIDPYFLSGGLLNSYTNTTPILDALTALDIDAVLAGTTDFTSYDCGLTGYLSFIGDTPVTSDTTLNLFQGSALISQTFGDDISKVLTVTTKATSGTAYSIQSTKSTSGTVAVDLKLKLENGTFYNGSFRNMVIGSQYVGTDRQGFSNAFYAFNDNPYLSNNKFIHTAEAYALSSNFALPPTKTYLKETSFNGYTTNPLTDFFASSVEPCVSLVANPSSTITAGYTSGISPSIISFTSDTPPPFGSVLSGAPFQAPINFVPINTVNKFSESDYVARIDLFSSQNSKIKQTKIIPFEAQGSTHIAITVDTLEGDIVVYVDGNIAGVEQLSAGTFFTSYYLNNNFGIGMPYIDNNPALYLNKINYDGYAKGYTFGNFAAYNKALTQDELRFDYLKNAMVDSVVFDITQGVRNNTDTITTYNKTVIPGRKSNNFKVYIKNLILSDEDKYRLNGILLNKIAKIVPLNSANIEFEYTNNTSEFIPLSTS